MKTGDIVYIADRKYVVYTFHPGTGMPYLMDFETGVIGNCWFMLGPDTPHESKPDNVEWLSIKRPNFKKIHRGAS